MPATKQGNSLWLDFTLPNWQDIYATWGSTFTGTFEVNSTVTGASPTFTGDLIRSTTTPGLFHLRLNYDTVSTTPITTWGAVVAGTYKLMVEFKQSTTKYREEKHYTLTINPQGIPTV